MPKSCIIFNPVAARGRGGALSGELLDIAPDSVLVPTEHPGHAEEVARRAAGEGCETVVAVGGDGTVCQVVNGLMSVPPGHRPALAVVPVGGGNDFAFACGIRGDTPEARRRALTGEAKPIDVARITDGRGRARYFANTAGLFFDAAVNRRSHGLRIFPGASRYFAALAQSFLLDFRAPRVAMTIDGRAYEENVLFLTLANGPREGGAFYCTPAAKTDDGRLDFFLVRKTGRASMLTLLPRVMRGTQTGAPRVRIGQFAVMELECEEAMPIHLDGEAWARREDGIKSVSVKIEPGALRVRS